MYTYPWYHWLTFFYIYCFFGWIFESTYVSLKDRRLVNRGFLRIPMLPLYGTGAVMMLWLSLPVQDNLFLVFCSGVIGATILEFITGWAMERLFKIKYWDYSHNAFNFHGYICLGTSMAWGLLTIFLTEVIHRPIADFVMKLPLVVEIPLLVIVTIIFVSDTIWSVKEALDLSRVLETMEQMKRDVEALRTTLREEAAVRAEVIHENTAYRAAQMADKAARAAAELADKAESIEIRIAERNTARSEAIADLVEEQMSRLEERQVSISEHIHTVLNKRHQVSHRLTSYQRRLLRGNPTATSHKYEEALKELREVLEERQKK